MKRILLPFITIISSMLFSSCPLFPIHINPISLENYVKASINPEKESNESYGVTDKITVSLTGDFSKLKYKEALIAIEFYYKGTVDEEEPPVIEIENTEDFETSYTVYPKSAALICETQVTGKYIKSIKKELEFSLLREGDYRISVYIYASGIYTYDASGISDTGEYLKEFYLSAKDE